MTEYDSAPETAAHILRVQDLMWEVMQNLGTRSVKHDRSKLGTYEKPYFDRMTEVKAVVEYGTPEYQSALTELAPALEHHYAIYRHHPQHFENGVNGMSLIDLMEMLADHKAAGEQTKNGSIQRSMEVNRERFGYSDQLYQILWNTIRELGWEWNNSEYSEDSEDRT